MFTVYNLDNPVIKAIKENYFIEFIDKRHKHFNEQRFFETFYETNEGLVFCFVIEDDLHLCPIVLKVGQREDGNPEIHGYDFPIPFKYRLWSRNVPPWVITDIYNQQIKHPEYKIKNVIEIEILLAT